MIHALLLAAAVAGAQPDCQAWNIAGYRIGMTKGEAYDVRGGKFKREGTELRPKVEGASKVWVDFDADGKLYQVWLLTSSDPGAVKLELVRRLGPPFADNLPAPPNFVLFGTIYANRTLWESEACGTDILTNVMTGDTGSIGVGAMHIFLVKHGVSPRDPRPPITGPPIGPWK